MSLFLHFTVNPKPPVTFLDVPRCSMTGKEQTVNRFQQIESRWGYVKQRVGAQGSYLTTDDKFVRRYSGTSDKIRFIVDRRIFIVGFGLYGSIHGPFEYQVLIQLIHTGSGRILGSNETNFLSDGTNATFRVMFKEPIEIMPNTNYTASATLKVSALNNLFFSDIPHGTIPAINKGDSFVRLQVLISVNPGDTILTSG